MTLGRQVFTLAHELAHAYFHSHGADVVVSMPGGDHGRERFADAFAGEFLVPSDELRRVTGDLAPFDDLANPALVVHLQRHFGVSFALEAEPDRAVVLHAMRPVVVAQTQPRPACFGIPEFLVGAHVPPRLFSVDLDAAPPTIEPAGPTDFPYSVSRSDVEQFRVEAKAPVADEILWHLELEWSCASHYGKTIVDDNGEPFVSYPRLKRGSLPDLGCLHWHLRGCPAERLAEVSNRGTFRITARGDRIRPDNGGADLLLSQRDVESSIYPRVGDHVTYRAQRVSNGIRAFSVHLAASIWPRPDPGSGRARPCP